MYFILKGAKFPNTIGTITVTEGSVGSGGTSGGGTVSNYKFKVTATPSTATVKLEAAGYTTVAKTGSAEITVASGTAVKYTVSASGYVTKSATVTVAYGQTLPVTLNKEGSSGGDTPVTPTNYTFTINPTPTSATVTLSATGYSTVSGTGSKSITVANGTKVNWSVSANGYTTRTGNWTISGGNKTESITLTTALADEFMLTSSMLKNRTYSTTLGDWNTSTKHLATDFIELDAGYDVVFDLPDDWQGYVAHVAKAKGESGEYTPTKTSVISGWVTKGIVSTGPSLDKYFIVLQKANKSTITPSDYDSITGSVQIKKPDARIVTIDSNLMNVGKGYSELNLITMANRLSAWYYALTPGSTVTGTIAEGLKAYIVSIRDGETEFNIDTEWVSSFNETYDTACSILIVAKKDDNSDFVDTSAWTSPVTINIK